MENIYCFSVLLALVFIVVYSEICNKIQEQKTCCHL